MDIIKVKTSEDVKSFLKSVEDVETFFLNTVTDRLIITKNDYGNKAIISEVHLEYFNECQLIHAEINGELLEELRDFFQDKEFETYCGRLDYAAMLARGIKLSIVLDYATPENRKYFREDCSKRTTILEKIQIARSSKKPSFRDGLYEAECAHGTYFGINIDEYRLNEAIQENDIVMQMAEQKVKEHLGDIDLSKPIQLQRALYNTYDLKLKATNKKTLTNALANSAGEQKEVIENIIEYKKRHKIDLWLNGVLDKATNCVVPAGSSGGINWDLVSQLNEMNIALPTSKYAFVYISYEHEHILKLVSALSDNLYENPKMIVYVASKVFNKPEEEITDEQKKAVMLATSNIVENYTFELYRLVEINNLGFNGNKVIKSVYNIYYDMDISNIYKRLYKSNLPATLKSTLHRLSSRGFIGIVQEYMNIERMMTEWDIVRIRKYFGMSNLRIRLISHRCGSMLYEIAKSDIDKLKKCLEDLAIDIEGRKFKLEIDRIIQ